MLNESIYSQAENEVEIILEEEKQLKKKEAQHDPESESSLFEKIKAVSLHKIPSGIYHHGLRSYSSLPSFIGTMVASVILLMFFGSQIRSLRTIKGLNIY